MLAYSRWSLQITEFSHLQSIVSGPDWTKDNSLSPRLKILANFIYQLLRNPLHWKKFWQKVRFKMPYLNNIIISAFFSYRFKTRCSGSETLLHVEEALLVAIQTFGRPSLRMPSKQEGKRMVRTHPNPEAIEFNTHMAQGTLTLPPNPHPTQLSRTDIWVLGEKNNKPVSRRDEHCHHKHKKQASKGRWLLSTSPSNFKNKVYPL